MAFLQRVFGGGRRAEDCVEGGPEGGQHAPASRSPTIPFAAAVDAVPPPASSAPFRSAAEFAAVRTLGTGSFGRVLLAQHRITGVYYAVKKLRKADVVRLRQVEHTNQERALLAQTQHPFIVRLAGTFQDAAHLYIVLEYVPGGELFSLLRRAKTLPPFVAVFYAAEVLLALEHLHARSIVYRDLKPENLLLDADGHLKLADFGFAKVVADVTYTLCGTPDYLAPEIVLSRGYGRAVDAYALGVLIYEMLVGAPPFADDVPARLYDNIVRLPPLFPPGFDPVARDLLERLLEKNPEARLGALAGGLADVRAHPWFASVRWDMLLAGRIRAPFRPTVSHPGDASNFDAYPEEAPASAADPDVGAYDGLFPLF